MATFFFYGTLLVPEILVRIIKHPGRDLTFQPGLLTGYSRHNVKGEDYPALIADDASSKLQQESNGVRGTIVRHLTPSDIALLTLFEGDEYAIKSVSVTSLSKKAVKLEKHAKELVLEEGLEESGDVIDAQTYVWVAGRDRLEQVAWDFKHFISEKLHLWTIPISSLNGNDPTDVQTNSVLPLDNPNPPAYGHSIKKYYAFSPNYVNLNGGAYGAAPLPVTEYAREMLALSESNPDRFLKMTYLPLMDTARARVAELVKAQLDDVVFQPNSTTGVNTIVHNISWNQNDIILAYSTTYPAILKLLQYTVDHHASFGLKLHVIPLAFPTTHKHIVSLTEQTIQDLNAQGKGKVRLTVIDAISSQPGMVFPWKELSKVVRKEGALSLVDAAHLIGQMPIDLSDPDICDFLVSNCHKWLSAKRAVAMLWVPERNQHLIRSSYPTSLAYGSGPFHAMFNWTATNDLSSYLSVTAALDFRAFLGGEKVITDYCHSLAVQGGKILQKALGQKGGKEVRIMENEKEELTANMVNVELPMPGVTDTSVGWAQYATFTEAMLDANCFAAVYVHDAKWWVRCSAQVWNEPSDFEYIGKVLKNHCAKLQQEA